MSTTAIVPRRPEGHPSRKLTDAQLAELRRRRLAGESHRSLGPAFGVTYQHINHLCRHLDVPDLRRKVSDEQLDELRRRRLAGEPVADLARAFNITAYHVRDLCRCIAAPDLRRKINREALSELRRRRAAGAALKTLAQDFNLSVGHISWLCRHTPAPPVRPCDITLIARCLHAVADRLGVSDAAITGRIVRGRPRTNTPRARHALALLLRRFDVTYRDIGQVVGAGDRVRSYRLVESARADAGLRAVVEELAAAISAERGQGALTSRSEMGSVLSIGKTQEREVA